MLKLKFFMGLLVFFLWMSTRALAGSYSPDYILEQVRLKKLPDYCAHMGALHWRLTQEGEQLRERYGGAWEHMHHFCWALVDFQKGLDWEAIDNLNYVLRNTRKDFPLRPLVLLQKARILSINRNYEEAVSAYAELVQIKPELEEGHVGLANTFWRKGDKKTAREIAERGLLHLPESKRLKDILKSGVQQ